MKRKIAIIALSILLILSGCNFLEGGNTTTQNPVNTNTVTQTMTETQTPTSTPTPTPTPTPTSTPTPTPTPVENNFTHTGGEFPTTKVLEKTASLLKEYGSFYYSSKGVYYNEDNKEEISKSEVVGANLTENKIYRIKKEGDMEKRQYRDGNEYYAEIQEGSVTKYYIDKITNESNLGEFSKDNIVYIDELKRNIINDTNFSINGTKTYNNKEVTVYHASGDNVSDESLSFGPFSYVLNASVTIYVDNDGLLHYVKITAEFDNSRVDKGRYYSDITTYEYTFSLKSIGKFKVERPSWADYNGNETSG